MIRARRLPCSFAVYGRKQKVETELPFSLSKNISIIQISAGERCSPVLRFAYDPDFPTNKKGGEASL
jgi:hypothetical protein